MTRPPGRPVRILRIGGGMVPRGFLDWTVDIAAATGALNGNTTASTVNGRFSNKIVHPDQKIRRRGRSSTAAGAYMITKEAHDDAVKHGIVHDFDDPARNAMALWLIGHEGALPQVRDGDPDAASTPLNQEWSPLLRKSMGQISAPEAKSCFRNQL